MNTKNADRCTIRETEGSTRGRVEVEIVAPLGYSFDGERHVIVARGATLAEARRRAREDANAAELTECKTDCDCRETAPIEVRTYHIHRENGDPDELNLCADCATTIRDYATIERSVAVAGDCDRCGAEGLSLPSDNATGQPRRKHRRKP